MASRQVSESLPETAGTPVSARRAAVHIVGAGDPLPGPRRRRATAGAPRKFWRPPALRGEAASSVRPYPGIRAGRQTGVESRLLEGEARPTPSTESESDFLGAFRKLRDVRTRHTHLANNEVAQRFNQVISRVGREVVERFTAHGGRASELPKHRPGATQPEAAYLGLKRLARKAELDGDPSRASKTRSTLQAIDRHALNKLHALVEKYGTAEAPAAQSTLPKPASEEPVAIAPALPSPAAAPSQPEWFSTYRPLRGLANRLRAIGWNQAHEDFDDADRTISRRIMHRFRDAGGKSEQLPGPFIKETKPEKAWHALKNMIERAERANAEQRAYDLRAIVWRLDRFASRKLAALADRYGPLENLFSMSTEGLRAMWKRQAPVDPPTFPAPTGAPSTTVTLLATAAPQQPGTVPEPTPPLPPTAGIGTTVTPPPVTDPWSMPTGAGSQATSILTIPAPAEPTCTPPEFRATETPGFTLADTDPSLEVPPARRESIVHRFRSEHEVLDAALSLQTGGAGALGWSAARCQQVLEDIRRIHEAANSTPAGAAALPGIDWDAIEELLPILDVSPPSP